MGDVRLDPPEACLLLRDAGGALCREVPLPPPAVKPLRAWMDVHEGGEGQPLFPSRSGGRLSTRALYKRMEVLGRMAGLSRALSPEVLRQTGRAHHRGR